MEINKNRPLEELVGGNIAGTRYDCWFQFEGHEWHGITYGENTQLCHCRKTKQKV